eukprot:TRINITY_DN8714_c0_g1_i1.p1 TRINITY_DN8714_c0_g1~~TRINITY_DN8714_c0_g1_i1.p1  ORF type:complete len:447 (-),score=83.28 TRINITY_DN8714_c0_g1_i1:46-1290(-)
MEELLVGQGIPVDTAKKYIQLLVENDIDSVVYADLSHDLLKDIGITSAGHRLKLLKIKEDVAKITAPSPPAVVSQVTDTFEYNEVKDRVEKFIQLDHNKTLTVTKIEKIINTELEKKYNERKLQLKKPNNTSLKFHGTSNEACTGIIEHGFRLPGKPGMFGFGIYFATDSSKSDQYTNNSHQMLLCEVAVGHYWEVAQAYTELTYNDVLSRGYDSVYAPRGTKGTGGVKYDEFIVYHTDQAIPRYKITYITKEAQSERQNILERSFEGPIKIQNSKIIDASVGDSNSERVAGWARYIKQMEENQVTRAFICAAGSKTNPDGQIWASSVGLDKEVSKEDRLTLIALFSGGPLDAVYMSGVKLGVKTFKVVEGDSTRPCFLGSLGGIKWGCFKCKECMVFGYYLNNSALDVMSQLS